MDKQTREYLEKKYEEIANYLEVNRPDDRVDFSLDDGDIILEVHSRYFKPRRTAYVPRRDCE